MCRTDHLLFKYHNRDYKISESANTKNTYVQYVFIIKNKNMKALAKTDCASGQQKLAQ